jgi:hypothetical protein
MTTRARSRRTKRPAAQAEVAGGKLAVIFGLLASAGNRTSLSIGGLSVEVLTSNALPTNETGLKEARKSTQAQLRPLIGTNVSLRGYQSGGYLLGAKALPRLGTTPVKPEHRGRFQLIGDVLERNRQQLLAIPGVLGVRAGYRFKDGWITDEPCIVAIVDQKLQRAALPSAVRIPDRIENVDVDVAIATPVQQLVSQAMRQGRAIGVDPVNPEGFAVPGASQPEQAFALTDVSAQLVRESKYVPPDNVQLEPVNGPFTIKCHASPDAGWPTLSAFLQQTKTRLTVAMYDFTAPHIMRTIEATSTQNNSSFSLILDPGQSLANGDEPNNPKSGDFTEDTVRKDLTQKLGSKFSFVWAAVTRKGKVDQGIFPTAYHIKVAVRDGTAFWLSSGNWQSSNQPDIDPLGPDRGLPNVQTTYNREWHVIVNDQRLAQTYEAFIKYDEGQAGPLNVSPQAAVRPDLFVPEDLVAQAVAAKYFAPKDIDIARTETVQPLLTPDNYADHILDLISQAKTTLYFQNQYIKISVDESKNPPKFAALVDALRGKIDDGVDVRIILRDIGDTRPMLEALKTNGFDMSKVKLQKSCHNKGIIVDGEIVAVGSHNWSGDGTVYNRDASLILFSKTAAQYFQQIFVYDWDHLARQKVSAESAMPRLALSGEATPEGAFRLPWDAYFGEYQADLQDLIGTDIPSPAMPERLYSQAARTEQVSPPAAAPLVTAQSYLVSGDLLAAKAELSKRWLRSTNPTNFRAQAAMTSPDPAVNVVGVGIGEMISGGTPTGLVSVRLLVRVKYTKSMIPPQHMLPEMFEGMHVDIQEVGTFRPMTSYPDPRMMIRPAQPGSSIGFEFPGGSPIMAGTFGGLVRDAAGTQYLLSNSHVLANEGQLPIGSPIYQQGPLDLATGSTKAQIAKLSKFIPFDPQPALVDCAMAEVTSPSLVSKDILYIGAPKGATAARQDMVVHKFGRTSFYTAGRVTMVNTDTSVDYDQGTVVFKNQIVVVGLNGSIFSQPGDSGSLILERDSQMAIGLLFAGSASHTLANRIEDVLQALNVTLVT